MHTAIAKRCSKNPLIRPDMVPFPSTLTYNAGITKFHGKYVMVFRNDHGYTEAQMRTTLTDTPWPGCKINLGLSTAGAAKLGEGCLKKR